MTGRVSRPLVILCYPDSFIIIIIIMFISDKNNNRIL